MSTEASCSTQASALDMGQRFFFFFLWKPNKSSFYFWVLTFDLVDVTERDERRVPLASPRIQLVKKMKPDVRDGCQQADCNLNPKTWPWALWKKQPAASIMQQSILVWRSSSRIAFAFFLLLTMRNESHTANGSQLTTMKTSERPIAIKQ